MNKLEMFRKEEKGQSLIIVGALVIVLVALIGLVVDAGNAYAQRRIVQNACDAAALAGAQMLAHQEDPKVGGDPLSNGQVILAAQNFAARNGVDPNDLTIYYTDINGNILMDASDIGLETIIDENTFASRAEGIKVEGDRNFGTYFVRVIGRTEMAASADAQGILACGACSAGGGEGLFPIAVHVGQFDDTEGLPVEGRDYRIFEKTANGPWQAQGGFGWLSWNQDPGHVAATELVDNMADTSRSGVWSVGDNIPTSTGFQNCSQCRTELQRRIDNAINMTPSRPATVTLPIFDYREGVGQNMTYHIVGFGRFRINCYHMSNGQEYGPASCNFQHPDNEHWISGTFVKWVDPTGESGCSNFGVCTAKLRPPLPVVRSLQVNVVANRISVQEDQICDSGEVPVDLVHVMDISGSMCAEWNGTADEGTPCSGRADGGSKNRILAAKDVITDFNEEMDWNEGNQVGLTTYPRLQSTYTYNTDCYEALGRQCTTANDCTQRANLLYFADKNVNLTTDLAHVNQVVDGLYANGGTSMPLGLQYGREMVTDPAYHRDGNLQVIILTTDGMANIKIDGHASGYIGNYTKPPAIVESGCNNSVYQAVVEQANLAKEQGVVIFTIGIHTNIDEDLMKAIASPNTDPNAPHFFLASDENNFESIYEQIQNRLPTLCNEECGAIGSTGAAGTFATVWLYDDHGNLVQSGTTNDFANVIFSDLEPGTYELKATWTDPTSGLLYDVLTWTRGGPPLGPGEKITVEIPEGTGTTNATVNVSTNQQLDCD